LPTFNRSKYIKRQLSFFLEDAADFIGSEVEIIVSNNASPDDTDEVIRDIEKNYQGKFFYKLQEENTGQRNFWYLIKKARGKFFWLVGDDDLLRPGIVPRLMGILKDHADKDVGAVLLKVEWAAPGADTDEADWSSWDAAGAKNPSGLLFCDCEALGRFGDLPDSYGMLNFITRNVLLRAPVVETIENPSFEDQLTTSPMVCALNALRGRFFYLDDKAAVYARRIHRVAMPRFFSEFCSVINVNTYCSLKKFGFSEEEVNAMITGYFEKGSGWAIPFIRQYFYPDISLKFIKTVIKHGYFRLFLKVYFRRLYRKTVSSIKRKFK
jgi:glycosyltransferase involved in cell wall biosynthesis